MVNNCTILKNKIFYSDYGKGQPIIFLPGLDGKSDIWNQQISELSMDFRVICLDFSKISSDFISLHNMMQLINEFVMYMELKSAIFVGYSVGAYFALSYSSRHPNMTNSIILTSLGALQTLDETAKYYIHNYNPPKSYFKRFCDKIVGKGDNNSYLVSRFAHLLKNSIISNEFSKSSSPILIVNGENDQKNIMVVSTKAYEEKGNFIVDMEIIPKVGKDCFVENPSAYNGIIKDFISRNISPL